MRFRRVHLPALALLCAAATGAAPAGAAPGDKLFDLLGGNVKARANGALAVLGISVVPSETASTLFFSSTGGKDEFDFKATQFGGAFTYSKSFPLYLEGFVGATRYDPVFLITQGASSSRIPAKWTGFSATGGVGWDFRLDDELVLRPIANIALGHIESDLSLAGRILENKTGLELPFLRDGRLNSYGLGGSVMLDFERYREDYEIDSELRFSYIHLQSFDSTPDVQGSAVASTLGIWNRLRVPTGLTVLRRPLRAVAELSASWLPGDQGTALHTSWLVQTGAGVEVDFSDTWVPIGRVRVMARYAFGNSLTGVSIGLGASF